MKTLNVNYPACPALCGVNTDEAKPSIIILPTCKGIMVIPVQQIIRIQSISNYSKLFFKDACPAAGGGKTLVVAKVLRWFQEQTALVSFVRIHRTHFVNINCIKNFRAGKNSILFLNNGEIFSVARRKKVKIAQQLSNLNNSFVDESACISQLNAKKILAA